MKRSLASICLFSILATAAAAQPVIVSLSNTTMSRSGRLLIRGSGFGTSQDNGRVGIAGLQAAVTRWADTEIAAYVPENAPVGANRVEVLANGQASNAVRLTVTPRPDPQGHMAWRFQADAPYIQSRPAVASDGTVYAMDVLGHLYALSRSGGLKWVFNASGYGFGNVTLGQDGTIYVGSTATIYAVRPNGKLLWQFNQSPAAFILLGPNVGPDGNVYAVGTNGMGVFSLTPQGTLRWSVPETYDRPIVELQEIVFGTASQSQLYFRANNHLRSLGLDGSQIFTKPGSPDTLQADPQPATSPDGTLYTNTFSALGSGLALTAFDHNGDTLWSVFDDFINSTNILSTPDVGPDDVIYDGRNQVELYAINPDGSVKWKHTDSGIMFAPVVSPLNNLVLLGGILDFGRPGFFEAVSTTGSPLWRVNLPSENGGHVWPISRARFAPDGRTAYLGTSIPGEPSQDAYSYLYSLRTER